MNFSIIIPSYNNYLYLENCLKSIFKNLKKIKSKYEIIIVDDCSDKYDILKYKNIFQHNKIKIIKNKKNLGPAYCRNIGAKNSKYEILIFFDSDIECNPYTIRFMLKKIKKYDVINGIYDLEPLNDGIFPKYKSYLDYSLVYSKKDYPHVVFSSSCAAINKKIFLSVGGFNNNIKWGDDYENEDLGCRLINKNIKIYNCPKIKIKHNFKTFPSIFKFYYLRTKNWMLFHMKNKNKFKLSGVTRINNGLGCLSILIAIFIIPLIKINNLFVILLVFALLYHFITFRNFYFITFKKNFFLMPLFILIHFFNSVLISIASINGFIKYFVHNSELLKFKF